MFLVKSTALRSLTMVFILCACMNAGLCQGTAKSAATVLLISVDGLKPEAVLHAQEHGLVLPNLTRMLQDGIYSPGVRGVLPTVTYPSHTTLLTGVSPARHGICLLYTSRCV